MTTTATHHSCDPWVGLPLPMSAFQRAALDPAERPPQAWGQLTEPQRAMLGGLALHILAAHEDGTGARRQLDFRRARLVEALHATVTLTERGGYGHDLTGYYVRDPETRAAWQRLDLALQSPPLMSGSLLDELLLALGAGGDFLQTLRRRRDAIDAQLSRIEQRRALGAGIR